MRKFLTAALAALLINPVSVFAQSEKPDKIVVAAYGGIWAESIKKNFVPCFEKKTGVKVDVITGESADWLARIRANPNKPPIDVLALGEADSLRAAREGLLDQATAAKVPNLADIPDKFHKPWGDHAIAQNIGAFGVMYNKEAIPNPPKTWREFFDAVAAGKYGKRISLPAGTYTWGPEFLWLVSQQYDGNIDTAFAKMKAASEKSVVKFWTTPVEALNMFGTKEVDAIVYWDGRANNFIDKGNSWAGFYIPDPGTIVGLAMLSKAKNAPDIAWQYINCALDPDNQLKHAETILYAVPNRKVVYPASIKDKVVPADKILIPPYDKIFDSFGSWIERWNKEIR
ncbi:MAG TPA: extracellular solute-binding protein [Bradyrhizobium sp.]|nr:extracellular solute-binding protein [Bradyrhizobium sp.]